MTDKEKLAKVRAEIERRKKEVIDNIFELGNSESERIGLFDRKEIYDDLLSFIDSMQEEPKECMYSTANYTNGDRLTLCKDCKELCRYNQKTAAESLGISQETYDEIVDKCLYGSEVELVDEFFNEMLDPNIQYASREAGIKAHAEDYSFNIDSELFQQLTPEQQKLWRKEIEQAVISGGYCGLSLAKDKRYDEKPTNEDLEEVSKKYSSCIYLEEVLSDDDKEVLRERLINTFKTGAEWQKQKMLANAVDGFVIEDIEEGNGDFLLSAEYLSKDMGLKDRQKVKVIVIKED